MFAIRRKEKEKILHCRFCKCTEGFGSELYETFPNKGIVCNHCLEHLETYVESFEINEQLTNESNKEGE